MQHSQSQLQQTALLINRICAVCVGTSPNRYFVNAMKSLDKEGTQDYHAYVYDFKGTYASIFEVYKKSRARVTVFGNYDVSIHPERQRK